MQRPKTPTILVIVGITGDLSRRYLLPAIEKIAAAGALPEQFHVVGVTRQAMTADDVLNGVDGSAVFLRKHLYLCQADLSKQADYTVISALLEIIEAQFDGASQRLFYLSVPPQASQPVVRLLGESGLSRVPGTKLLLEKPFGTDLQSAEALIAETQQYFDEDQIYRIDHYLAKEVAQSLIVFREANSLFAHTWNKDFIERIDVVALESIDVEGRGAFYEQTGALRDVLQSHVLQLAALTLMDDADTAATTVPERRLAALRQLYVPSDVPMAQVARRGQYEGYQNEVNNPGSDVETYVELTLRSRAERWQGVPVYLKTGKALDRKQTAIHITYRSEPGVEPNRLQLQVQPDAKVALTMWAKEPGYEYKHKQQTLQFTYGDFFEELPDAYEQVIVDAITSTHTLFTSGEEVRESWRMLEPVQHEWSMHAEDLLIYPKGSDPSTF